MELFYVVTSRGGHKFPRAGQIRRIGQEGPAAIGIEVVVGREFGKGTNPHGTSVFGRAVTTGPVNGFHTDSFEIADDLRTMRKIRNGEVSEVPSEVKRAAMELRIVAKAFGHS